MTTDAPPQIIVDAAEWTGMPPKPYLPGDRFPWKFPYGVVIVLGFSGTSLLILSLAGLVGAVDTAMKGDWHAIFFGAVLLWMVYGAIRLLRLARERASDGSAMSREPSGRQGNGLTILNDGFVLQGALDQRVEWADITAVDVQSVHMKGATFYTEVRLRVAGSDGLSLIPVDSLNIDTPVFVATIEYHCRDLLSAPVGYTSRF